MNEYLRKTSHLLFGLLIAFVIGFFTKPDALIILGCSLAIGLILIDLCIKEYHLPIISYLVSSMEREGSFPGKGALFFVITSLCVLAVFPSFIASVSIAVLAVLDCFATVFGIRFGRHRIYNGKSLEGFFGGFIGTLLFFSFFAPLPAAIVISFVAGVVELVSPVDDNLIIPWVIALMMSIFH